MHTYILQLIARIAEVRERQWTLSGSWWDDTTRQILAIAQTLRHKAATLLVSRSSLAFL